MNELIFQDPNSALQVLMVRTIGAQEVQFTKDDIRSLADKTKGIQKANTSHCAARKLPGLKAPVSRDLPLDAWPADVVCYAGITDLLIDLHVILLVWEKVGQLDCVGHSVEHIGDSRAENPQARCLGVASHCNCCSSLRLCVAGRWRRKNLGRELVCLLDEYAVSGPLLLGGAVYSCDFT